MTSSEIKEKRQKTREEKRFGAAIKKLIDFGEVSLPNNIGVEKDTERNKYLVFLSGKHGVDKRPINRFERWQAVKAIKAALNASKEYGKKRM